MDNLSVTIRMAKNGVVVECDEYSSPGSEHKTYVYKNLADAIKELPSVFSVLKDGVMSKTDEVERQTKSGMEKSEEYDEMIHGKKEDK